MQKQSSFDKEIILYCKGIINKYIDLPYLKKSNIFPVIILKSIYDASIENYKNTGNYEISFLQLEEVLKYIFLFQQNLKLFLDDKIRVSEILENDLFIFDYPEKHIKENNGK